MMEICRLSGRILCLVYCLQGIYAACEIPDASLELKRKITGTNAVVIGCKNESLVMTVGKVKTNRASKFNNEIFECDDQTFTIGIMGQTFNIMEAKCISRVTCTKPTNQGVDITEIEKQLNKVGGHRDTQFSDFDNYTAGDRIYLKCAGGYGQPKSSCDDQFDYSQYETNYNMPAEGTFTCKDDGKWNSDPVIECKEIICNWTGKHMISNGRLVGLKDDGKYALGDTILADCDAGFKSTMPALCESNGCFSTTAISCVEINCARLENYNSFENGHIVYSNHPITVYSTAKFFCDPGYVRYGPHVLTCQEDGAWSDHDCITCQSMKYANEPPTLKTSCPSPCVPYGAIKEGSNYEIGDTVLFRCHYDFNYLGVANTMSRVCLGNAMWSGTDIRCSETDKRVALKLGEAMENVAIRAEENFKEWEKNNSDLAHSRTIDIHNSLQLYLLVDSSGSITNQSFDIMKLFLTALLEKVFSANKTNAKTDVMLRFFGSKVSKEYKFTSLLEFQNKTITRADVNSFTAADTNIPKALSEIRTEINTRKAIDEAKSYSPNRCLVVISDGQNNIGGDSYQDIINEIHSVAETYAIFIGKKEGEMGPIDRNGFQQMKKIASNNYEDPHFFSIECGSDNCKEGLNNIIQQMTNVTADPIQCGEASDLQKLNEDHDSFKDAEEGAWPWMVSLEDERGTHKCGATILNNEWILTAAHCNITEEWSIYIGRTKKSSNGQEFKRGISKVIAHQDYNDNTFEYDVCVVKLANNVFYNRRKPFAAPVCLYNGTEFPDIKYDDLFKNQSRGVVTGWGKTKEGGASSKTLKQLQIRIYDSTKCQQNHLKEQKKKKGEYNNEVNFCALGRGTDNENIDACEGDSGGPFVVKVPRDTKKNGKEMFIQIGIVSWGKGDCGTNSTMGYYTRLTPKIIEWINKKISEN